jgi:hypothetical protein
MSIDVIQDAITGVAGALIVWAIHAVRRAIVGLLETLREHERRLDRIEDRVRRISDGG